jgi:hypothetical protein
MQEYELAEGGIVYLPKQIPHGYRITSKKADLLMINTPAGIEGMFRETGRDKSTPRPAGFEVKPDPGSPTSTATSSSGRRASRRAADRARPLPDPAHERHPPP